MKGYPEDDDSDFDDDVTVEQAMENTFVHELGEYIPRSLSLEFGVQSQQSSARSTSVHGVAQPRCTLCLTYTY